MLIIEQMWTLTEFNLIYDDYHVLEFRGLAFTDDEWANILLPGLVP